MIPHKKPSSKPTFDLIAEATVNTPAIISITSGKCSCGYYVSSLPAAWGLLALRMEKYEQESGSDHDEDLYDVMLDGLDSSCGCKGFHRWGALNIDLAARGGEEHPESRGCKHIAAAVWLLHERQYVPPLLSSFIQPESPPEAPPDEPIPAEEESTPPEEDEPPFDPWWDLGGEGVTRGDCQRCEGSGLAAQDEDRECTSCQGWGSVEAAEWWARRQTATPWAQEEPDPESVACGRCDGRGLLRQQVSGHTYVSPCPDCGGKAVASLALGRPMPVYCPKCGRLEAYDRNPTSAIAYCSRCGDVRA